MSRPLFPGSPLVLVLLLIVLARCDSAGRRSEAALPTLPAALELRIGSVDDPATVLTYIRSMVVDDDGRIYTTHPQESSILVHDRDGNRVARIGGAGEGPGEFRGLGAMGLLGDTLWAFDYRLGRVSYFSPAGELLRTVTIPVEMGRDPTTSPPRPGGLLQDGRVFGSPPAWSREVAAGRLTEMPVVFMDTLGNPGDTLYMFPLSVWAIQDPKNPMAFASYGSQPFADETLFAHAPRAPEYVVVHRRVDPDAPAPTFRVVRFTLDGDTIFDREYDYAPVPIDPALVDSLVESHATRVASSDFGNPPSRKQAAEWARATLYIPAHYPPVRTARVGLDGTIWLRTPTTDPAGETASWLMLEPDGEPIGRAELPARVQVEVARRDRVWGWTVDELDVPYIVRYRVGPGATGDS